MDRLQIIAIPKKSPNLFIDPDCMKRIDVFSIDWTKRQVFRFKIESGHHLYLV